MPPGVTADITGAEVFIVAAADTVMDRPNSDLVAECFPSVQLRDGTGEHDTLLAIDKARSLLGYEPAHSWRDTVPVRGRDDRTEVRTVEIVAAESTNLFVGTEESPRQVVRLRLRGAPEPDGREPARVRVEGDRLRSPEPLIVGPLGPGDDVGLEIGVIVDGAIVAGEVRDAAAIVEDGAATARQPFSFVVVEPGWRMFMISHFHYDPVWWNTQAAYTETWGTAIQYRVPFQEPGLALVKAHLEACRRDPDYKFVLAELDYLKPYWAVFPEDRAYIRQLLAEGRLELMGGTYNEPNTNLTSDESTIRNAIYGVAYQRDVLGGSPATAWQLDAFGHSPQFPAIMANAGITSSSWARGPFHEWGPHWVRGPARTGFENLAPGDKPRMQFASEFEWVAPSGRGLLTSFQANHYSAGWWMDAATTLEEAELEVHRLFTDLAALAATKNVLLPVGTDYSPPNKWLTAIHRDWARRYVWPKFLAAIPREFFEAVREERGATGRSFTPQTRDMNPIYTGKDVSFIDTKQAQRIAENTLLAAEKFGSLAMLLGARFPSQAIDKAWRQLLFGAHHDGITGSESDQVYLDLLGGWREALELGKASLDGALRYLAARVDTAGEGQPVVVFNPMAWARTDVGRVVVELTDGQRASSSATSPGRECLSSLEAIEPGNDRAPARGGSHSWPATCRLSATGRTERCRARGLSTRRPGEQPMAMPSRTRVSGWSVDRGLGGTIRSLYDTRAGKELILPGRVANEILAYREYPNHPIFGEGPWHLTPAGSWSSSSERPAEAVVEVSAIGRRVIVEGEIRGLPPSARDDPVGRGRPGRVHDPPRRVRGPRPTVPCPVPDRRRGWPPGLGGRERRHRAAVRLPERGCRTGPVHARQSGLQLVRAGRHRAGGTEADRDARGAASGDRNRRRGGDRRR